MLICAHDVEFAREWQIYTEIYKVKSIFILVYAVPTCCLCSSFNKYKYKLVFDAVLAFAQVCVYQTMQL